MNGAFLHLAINHIPVVGAPFAFFLLAFGMARKSRDLIQAGFITLILMGLGAYPVVKTGSLAARQVHELPGVTHEAIHEHAEAADFGFWGSVGLGVISLLGFMMTAKRPEAPKAFVWIALIGSLWLSTVMIRVAHLGGLIRHPEVAKGYVAPADTDHDH